MELESFVGGALIAFLLTIALIFWQRFGKARALLTKLKGKRVLLTGNTESEMITRRRSFQCAALIRFI